MAKATKGKLSVESLGLLKLIASATVSGNHYFVTQVEASPLLEHNPPLIEVNTDMIENGKAAARATTAGAGMASVGPAEAPVEKQTFGLIKGAVLPPSKRGVGLHPGAPKQYPFEDMDIGDSFFVAVTAKHPNPVKTLQSTVSSANHKYSEETGEKRTLERKVRGEDRKAKVDAAGNFITETVQIPVRKALRRFEIRGVEKGKQYGEFTAPENGALIARVPLSA